MLEESDSDEQQPFSLINRKLLGEVLFASGALAHVKGRNRHVLYELAELFDRKRKSKKRGWEDSGLLKPVGAANTAAEAPAAVTAGATPEATARTLSAGKGTVSESANSPCIASGGGLTKSKKQKKQHVPVKGAPAEVVAAKQDAQGSLEASRAGKSRKQLSFAAKKVAEIAGAGPMGPGNEPLAAQQTASLSAASSDSDRSDTASPASATDARQKKRRKKRKGMQEGDAVPGDGPNGRGNNSSIRTGDQRSKRQGLTRNESTKLTNAVDKAVKRCQQKRISFNLSKNLVHEIGKPLPPAELRTPPSAKPSGSALKKGSSARFQSAAVARKLVF